MDPLPQRFQTGVRSALRGLLAQTRAGRRLLFTQYMRANKWGDLESVSGPWSNMARTETVRQELPKLIRRLTISTMLDVPCGDGYWMHLVDHGLERYIGVDIVPDLIERLQASARQNTEYRCLDAISDPLPKVDAIFSRDFFIHLSNKHINQVLANMRRSGSEYLIASTYTEHHNVDIGTGQWRPVNLSATPFNFGEPLDLIIEESDDARYADKSLGVWRLETLPDVIGY